MSELQRLQDAFLKADNLAQQGDEKAREDAAAFAKEIRRLQSQQSTDGPNMAERFLGQAARRIGTIADSVVTGAENDVRRFMGKDVIPYGEGRVQNVLESAGIASSEDDNSALGAAGSAFGESLTLFAPMLKGFDVARKGSGVAAQIADDMYRTLSSRIGLTSELAATSAGAASEQAVRNAGGPEWLANTANVAGAVAGGGLVASTELSSPSLVRKGYRAARRALTPMTDEGAREVASQRLEEFVGTERMTELGKAIDPADEFGRTPAQQTGDPRLLGLEEAVAAEDPMVNQRLLQRREDSEKSILSAVREMGGDPQDAQTFLRRRLKQFGEAMDNQINDIMYGLESRLARLESDKPGSEISVSMVGKLEDALERNVAEERRLWQSIPRDVTVDTSRIADKAEELIASNSKYQSGDVPGVIEYFLRENARGGDESADLIRQVFGDGGEGSIETVADLHGLYSELRRISRVARAGDSQNRNMARIADGVADAILREFEGVDISSPAGKSIAEARAFTKQLNERFRTGAVGRILKTTSQNAPAMEPETALRRTVVPREAGRVADEQIREAAPEAAEDVAQFFGNEIYSKAINASGKFDPAAAERWLRANGEALQNYPELRSEFESAIQSGRKMSSYMVTLENRKKLATQGPLQGAQDDPVKAVHTVFGSKNPARAAKLIANAASKDSSGKAVEGIKGAFTDYLTADLNVLPAILSDPKKAAALSNIFTKDGEMARLRRIADAARTMSVEGTDVGETLNKSPNRVLSMVVKTLAASHAASTNRKLGLTGTIQAPGFASNAAQDWLKRLTNDKATQLLKDAVEDPELFKVLLMNVPGPKLPPKAESKLKKYLLGTSLGVGAGAIPSEE